MRDRVAELEMALREIINLASWHCDSEADPKNLSPEDNVSHVNGLIVRRANEALDSTPSKQAETK